MEIVTGKAGTPHVSSADDGRRIAGIAGAGSYVLGTGGRLAPSLVDANTVRFATGDMIVQGRHIGLTAPEDVKVESGSQGKKRTDYLCVHYRRDVSGANPTLVETVEWSVLQGTPGTEATAPSVPAGSILDGDAEAYVPVASVSFDGLTTGTPALLLPELAPLASAWDASLLYDSGGWRVYAVGLLVIVQADAVSLGDGSWASAKCPYSIPKGLRPKSRKVASASVANGATPSVLWVETSGEVTVRNQGGTGRSGGRYGMLSYLAGM